MSIVSALCRQARERTARDDRPVAGRALRVLNRLGLHLAGTPGNHVEAGGCWPSCAFRGEHRCARAEGTRSASSATADSQLVARHERFPRGAAEPVRLLAPPAAVSVLLAGAMAEPHAAHACAAAVDGCHRIPS